MGLISNRPEMAFEIIRFMLALEIFWLGETANFANTISPDSEKRLLESLAKN
jgi:hypothetical protein